MSGNGMMPRSVILFWGALLLPVMTGGINALVMAGNRHMVESSVRQLDAINKKAVSTIPELPANAVVDLKADVRYSGGEPQIRIYEKSVRETREESFEFGPRPLKAEGSVDAVNHRDVNGTNATNRRNDAVH